MPYRAGDRYVLELSPLLHAAEEETAAAHVAAADEGGWEEEAVSEDREERLDVTRAGDAAEEDHPTVLAGQGPERLRVPS